MSESTKKAASPKKVKAVAAKKPAQHPTYKEMIPEAVRTLKERNGSSRQKISKYIAANFSGLGDENSLKRNLRAGLKKLVESGTLIQVKGTGASGSFKLAAAAKKVPSAKKPAATKKSSTVKKAATAKPKKTTPKKKVAVVAKPKAKKVAAAKKPKAKVAKKPASAKKPAAGKPKKSPLPKKAAAAAAKKPAKKTAAKKTAPKKK